MSFAVPFPSSACPFRGRGAKLHTEQNAATLSTCRKAQRYFLICLFLPNNPSHAVLIFEHCRAWTCFRDVATIWRSLFWIAAANLRAHPCERLVTTYCSVFTIFEHYLTFLSPQYLKILYLPFALALHVYHPEEKALWWQPQIDFYLLGSEPNKRLKED